MVKDHSKANEELKAIAKEENVEWPAEKEAGKWKSDKDYMDAMVKDHEKDLAEFEKEAKRRERSEREKFRRQNRQDSAGASGNGERD